MIPRTTLEYHLETLTNRGQEGAFEHFARLLAGREICPNLLPHTGPTGGGDSKVDAETYPVADGLALSWYVGIGREAARERWAFAFSAKRDWRTKVQSDVAKIAATGRGYSKAFFVSNQFVPDKTRAKIEDDLRKKHGLDVRILDRSWILDRVYQGKHEQLVIDELHVQLPDRVGLQRGPFDTMREQELKETETEIDRAVREQRIGPGLVDDMLHSALLARGLERPRTEVEGRFARALAAAEKVGSTHHTIQVMYHEAFTAFFWYEDYTAFLAKLSRFERLVDRTDNIHHLELASTLWSALFSGVTSGFLDREHSKFGSRTKNLLKDLDAVAKTTSRPSAALHAEGLAIQIRLAQATGRAKDDLLAALRGVIARSSGLLGFPMSAWIDLITALGAVLGDRKAYNDLHEAAVAAAAERQGDVAAAQLLLKRGGQQMDAGQPYDAIRTLGKGLARLYKEESRDDLMHALYLIGSAYEQVGLLWAARGSFLSAASIAVGELWTEASVTHAQRLCLDRLRWLELRLGRLPHALAWHEVTMAIKSALAQHGADFDLLREGNPEFDGTLGILLLRTDPVELVQLEQLPDTLDGLALPWASLTLQFLLGHKLPDDDQAGADKATPEQIFQGLADQPAAAQLPPRTSLCGDATTTLTSRVLGCELRVQTESVSPALEVAESILAGFESLLSTATTDSPIVARVPTVTIDARRFAEEAEPFAFEVQDRDGLPHVDVRVGKWSVHVPTKEQQRDFRSRLAEVLVRLLSEAFFVGDIEGTMTELLGGERAMERAVNFTGSMVTVGEVLGHAPKQTLASWIRPGAKRYRFQRTEPWRPTVTQPPTPDHSAPPSRDDVGAAWKSAKHSDMRVDSLIRPPLWDKAKWWATLFMTERGDLGPPALAPVFRDAESARRIFELWRQELGEHDPKDRLRLSIIRGVSAANPYAYRIAIGSNLEASKDVADGRFVIMMSRCNQMDPQSPENLDRFLRSYERHRALRLFPAVATGGIDSVRPQPRLRLEKQMIHVMEAWQVGPGDPESGAIAADDVPIIPNEHQGDAPVLQLLGERRENAYPVVFGPKVN